MWRNEVVIDPPHKSKHLKKLILLTKKTNALSSYSPHSFQMHTPTNGKYNQHTTKTTGEIPIGEQPSMWGVWCCGSWNFKECRNSNCLRPAKCVQIQITKLDVVQHTALLPAKHSCWRASKKVGKHLLYSNGPH